MRSSSGNSCRHGPHQLAQKLMSTTLPLYSSSLRFVPWRLLSVKSGAACSTPTALASNGAPAMQQAAAQRFTPIDFLFMRTPRQFTEHPMYRHRKTEVEFRVHSKNRNSAPPRLPRFRLDRPCRAIFRTAGDHRLRASCTPGQAIPAPPIPEILDGKHNFPFVASRRALQAPITKKSKLADCTPPTAHLEVHTYRATASSDF